MKVGITTVFVEEGGVPESYLASSGNARTATKGWVFKPLVRRHLPKRKWEAIQKKRDRYEWENSYQFSVDGRVEFHNRTFDMMDARKAVESMVVNRATHRKNFLIIRRRGRFYKLERLYNYINKKYPQEYIESLRSEEEIRQVVKDISWKLKMLLPSYGFKHPSRPNTSEYPLPSYEAYLEYRDRYCKDFNEKSFAEAFKNFQGRLYYLYDRADDWRMAVLIYWWLLIDRKYEVNILPDWDIRRNNNGEH